MVTSRPYPPVPDASRRNDAAGANDPDAAGQRTRRTRDAVRVRSASIAERSNAHASSIVAPTADATETSPSKRSASAVHVGSDLQQSAVAGPQVVLPVVERRAPAGALEDASVVGLDEDTVAAGPRGRSAQVHRHVASLNDRPCGSSVPIACAQLGDDGPRAVGIATAWSPRTSVGSPSTRRQDGARCLPTMRRPVLLTSVAVVLPRRVPGRRRPGGRADIVAAGRGHHVPAGHASGQPAGTGRTDGRGRWRPPVR